MTTADWPLYRRAFYRFFLAVMGRYVEMFTDEQTVEGLENVPEAGPCLVVSNHLNFTDPEYISRTMPRPINFMVKKEFFSYPVVGFGLRLLGAFPVDREGNDIGAVRTAFPGAGYLALKAGVPVLPVGVFGSEHVRITRLPSGSAKRVGLRIGKPFLLDPPEEMSRQGAAEWAAWEMLRRIACLLPETYHGVLTGVDHNPVSS